MGTSASVNPTPSRARSFDFETFPAAVGLSLIAGGLALAAPFLNSLVLALAALAVAGWVVDRRAGARGRGGGWRPGVLFGWTMAGLGAVAFFALPAPVASVRGLLLACSLLPLWANDRRSSRSHPSRSGGP